MADPKAVQDITGMMKNGEDCKVEITLDAAESFFKSFERAARRWEIIIYPAMIGGVIMMFFGFYLIYNLSRDMRSISKHLDPNMGLHMSVLAGNMQSLTDNIHLMSQNIEEMTEKVSSMTVNLNQMNVKMNAIAEMKNVSLRMSEMSAKMDALAHMKSIDLQMAAMNKSIHVMTANMDRMRYDFSVMNRNVSRPLSMMNSVMPF